MGMYDWITTPEVKCPQCNEILSGFQSKDGPCLLDTIHYTKVNNFYTGCIKCDNWIQFDKEEEQKPIPGYNMTYRDEF